VLGIITFVPAWLTAAGIKVFSFVAPLAPPYSYMGPGVAGFMILGVIYLIYLYRTDPRRVVEVGWSTWIRWRSTRHERPAGHHDHADPRSVRVDVRRGGPAGPGPDPGHPGAVHRGLLRRPGAQRDRPGLGGCEFPYLNPQTGPFYIEGAEPGDTLAVHFISIEPARDWGASTTVPLFGALSATHVTALLHDPLPEIVWLWEFDRAKGTCQFKARRGDYTVDLPLNPMHGTVGVAPANLEVRSALVPDAFGGNMDTPEMRAGVTCYWGSTSRARSSRWATGTPAR